jgi:hypothetical protein
MMINIPAKPDPNDIIRCQKCHKDHAMNPDCEHYVECLIGENQMSNYIRNVYPLVEKVAKELGYKLELNTNGL